MWNVAYLFDQTPAYRPWLSWIGIDIRRLGLEDLVCFRTIHAVLGSQKVDSKQLDWPPNGQWNQRPVEG